MCEFIFVSGFFFSAVYEYSADENVYFYTAVQVCECGMLFWTFWSLRDVRAIASNPFDGITASDPIYHGVSWTACAVVGVGMILVYEQSSEGKDDRMDTIKRVNYGLAALEIMFMLLTLRTMKVLYTRLSWGLPLSEQSRKRVIFQELTMGGGFVFSDLLAILIMFGFKTAGSPVALDVLRQLRVIFDTVIWMYVNRIHLRLRQSANAEPVQEEIESERTSYSIEQEDNHQFGEKIRHELVILTALGIFKCAEAAEDGGLVHSLNQSVCQKTSTSSTSSTSEELHATVKQLLERSAQQGATRQDFYDAGLTDADFDQLDLNGDNVVDLGEMTHNASWSFTSIHDKELSHSKTGGEKPKLEIPWTQSHDGKKQNLDFYDYKSATFAAIRQALGVSASDYQAAFKKITNFVAEDPSRDMKSWDFSAANFREIVSSGASGSYFYFTPDKDFIVKQVSPHEKDTLIDISESYLRHCYNNPGTTIHYYGMHSIRMPFSRQKAYFVVMKNFLKGAAVGQEGFQFDLTFDLKGATTNRCRLKEDGLAKVRAGGKGSSLLDWDWMNLQYRLDVDSSVQRALSAIVRSDLQYLASERLLDYSILLGFTTTFRAANGPDPRPDKQFCDSFDDLEPPTAVEIELSNSPRSDIHCDRNSIVQQPMINMKTGVQAYCLGMIDILERWNNGWASQGVILKCICSIFGWPGNPRGITAIEPNEYAWRFDEFFQDKILAMDDVYDDWRQKSGPTWKPWR